MNSSIILPKAENTFLKKYLYLFFVDIDTMANHDRGYEAYEKTEKNYAEKMLKAYCEVFTAKKETTLNLEAICKINATAMSHLANNSGKIRSSAGKFVVKSKYGDSKTEICASSKGLEEFIQRWFIESKQPTHALMFTPEGESTEGAAFLSMSFKNNKRFITFNRISYGKFISEAYDAKRHLPLLKVLLSLPNYINEVNSMPDTIIGDANVSELTEKVANHFIDHFKNTIDLLKDSDEKILCILKLVQILDQLHITDDGNVRTSYILLNYFLDKYYLPMTILVNPNRFDMFSLEELLADVKAGQAIFIKLCQDQIPVFNDFHIPQKNYTPPTCEIYCNTTDLELFIESVIRANYKKYLSSPAKINDYGKTSTHDHKLFNNEVKNNAATNSVLSTMGSASTILANAWEKLLSTMYRK